MELDYRFVFSPQVKDERYLYIYSPQTETLLGAELMSNPEDSLRICDSKPPNTGLIVMQPFRARFTTVGGCDLVLLTDHTSPTVNGQEFSGLEKFYRQTENQGEPDVIILGDLNSDCKYVKNSDKWSCGTNTTSG